MRGRESSKARKKKKKGEGEERVFRTERRGYGNTGGVNERWRENPYEYRRVGGAGEARMRLSDPSSLHGSHGSSDRMERESLVVPGGQIHPREASMRVRETTPSHDFHVHNRMERESLDAPPSHDFHVSSHRMERESLDTPPSHDFHASRNTTPSHDFHVARNTTPSHDFHVRGNNRVERESLVVPGGELLPREASMVPSDAPPTHDFHGLSHRMERESLVVVGGEELHPREASMTFRNPPPANENAPSSQDYHDFLMEIEGTLFLNSMEEAGRSAQQRRR